MVLLYQPIDSLFFIIMAVVFYLVTYNMNLLTNRGPFSQDI